MAWVDEDASPREERVLRIALLFAWSVAGVAVAAGVISEQLHPTRPGPAAFAIPAEIFASRACPSRLPAGYACRLGSSNLESIGALAVVRFHGPGGAIETQELDVRGDPGEQIRVLYDPRTGRIHAF